VGSEEDMRLRRTAALLVGVGTLVGAAVVPATAAGGEQPEAVAPGTTGTVTLVTGDVIGYGRPAPPSRSPTAGRGPTGAR
jgi:hypothetical protein